MALLKTLSGALLFTLLSASPALAQVRVVGPTFHVRVAPPAPLVERIPVAPSPRHIWAPGHWDWNPGFGRHVWVRGYYQLGAPGRIWVASRWVNQGSEWVYYPAHWSTGVEQPVYAQPQPLPPYQPQQPVYQPQQPVYEQPQPVYQPQQPVYQPQQPVYEQPPQPYYEPPQPVEVQYEAAPPQPQVEVIPAAPSPNHTWIAGYWGWRGGRHFWYPGRYELRRPGQVWQAASWNRHGRFWRYSPGYWRAY